MVNAISNKVGWAFQSIFAIILTLMILIMGLTYLFILIFLIVGNMDMAIKATMLNITTTLVTIAIFLILECLGGK